MTPETPREVGRHQPGDFHTYPQIECEVCGQRGMVTVSLEPQRSAAAPGLPAAEGLRAALQAVWDLGDELDSNHARFTASKVAERFGVEIEAHNRFSEPPRNRNEEQLAALQAELDECRAAADRAERGLPLPDGHPDTWPGGTMHMPATPSPDAACRARREANQVDWCVTHQATWPVDQPGCEGAA